MQEKMKLSILRLLEAVWADQYLLGHLQRLPKAINGRRRKIFPSKKVKPDQFLYEEGKGHHFY